MPDRPMKPCGNRQADPPCRQLTRDRYCPDCAGRLNRDRPTTRARGYAGTWPALRARQLIREPRCRMCGQPAREVDHITPLRHGGGHDPANLQSVCRTCHRRKTALHDGGFGR